MESGSITEYIGLVYKQCACFSCVQLLPSLACEKLSSTVEVTRGTELYLGAPAGIFITRIAYWEGLKNLVLDSLEDKYQTSTWDFVVAIEISTYVFILFICIYLLYLFFNVFL
jgi:hypothetical protein